MRMRGYRIYTTDIHIRGHEKRRRIPSVDFKCAMTIYPKSRSIIAVVFNNSFIPLATRRTEKTTAAGD